MDNRVDKELGAVPGEGNDRTAVVLNAESGKPLLIPDGGWFLGGEYIRQGSDLVIKGTDGQLVVIRDFFSVASAPDLYTGTGAVIKATLAAKLAGPLAPGQYAQSTPQAAPGEPIGEAAEVDGEVKATRADGTEVELEEGDPVFHGDVIETGEDGSIGI